MRSTKLSAKSFKIPNKRHDLHTRYFERNIFSQFTLLIVFSSLQRKNERLEKEKTQPFKLRCF